MKACGGAYSADVRRKYFISGPQWAAAYPGHALFHAPEIGFAEVIRKYAEIGIGYWTTHDSDVIPTEAMGTQHQSHPRRYPESAARERRPMLDGNG